MEEIVINAYFDGMMSPTNPDGFGCGGWWYEAEGLHIKEGGNTYYVPGQKGTNNMAEYGALIDLLNSLISDGLNEKHPVIVKGDSQLTINQMAGTYRVGSAKLKPLHQQAKELAEFFHNITFEWIPREKNWRADQLAEAAFSRATVRNRVNSTSVHSIELFEYKCDKCRHSYVMRILDNQTYCIMCGNPLRKEDFSMRNTPAGRVFYTLREAGYRTVMYKPDDQI